MPTLQDDAGRAVMCHPLRGPLSRERLRLLLVRHPHLVDSIRPMIAPPVIESWSKRWQHRALLPKRKLRVDRERLRKKKRNG